MYYSSWYKDGDAFDVEPLYPGALQADDLNALLVAGMSVSFYNNGSIVAVAGILQAWTGVANVILQTGVGFKNCHIKIIKEIKILLAIYADTNNIRKYYTTVEKPFIGWVKLLGFTHEYTMKEACPDSTDLFGYCLLTEG